MLNVCMVGHGMMGIWHSEALRKHSDCQLHTVVGRRRSRTPEEASADRGPQAAVDRAVRREVRLPEVDAPTSTRRIADPEVDIVIIAGPSETHAEMALAALEQGKHVLVEIPIAMNLEGAEAGRGRGQGARADPRRGAPDAVPTGAAARSWSGSGRGEERVSHVQGRFFIHRLAQRRRDRAAAQLDRQPALAPHHAPDRLRAVDGRRAATWPPSRSGSGNVYSVLPADRAAHRHPDGAGAGGRDRTTTRRSSAPARTTRASTSTTPSW